MSTLSAAISASASALSAERTRIEAAVSNLANAESTQSLNGQPYRRRDVILRAEPVESFAAALGRSTATGVKVARVVEDQSELRRRYEPGHPGVRPGGAHRREPSGRTEHGGGVGAGAACRVPTARRRAGPMAHVSARGQVR